MEINFPVLFWSKVMRAPTGAMPNFRVEVVVS